MCPVRSRPESGPPARSLQNRKPRPPLQSLTCASLSSFEKTLKQKLAQKSSGATNEEAVLLKAFKYFDLNNNGTVEPDEFAKAVEKIGIMIPTAQVSLTSPSSPLAICKTELLRPLSNQRSLNRPV